jgi:DNA-binding MarR family transcriptional regulator
MRSSLEFLLLTLIREGLGTPYELKARADISLGSTVPALARLEDAGLIKACDTPQSRSSRRFTITAEGARTLKNHWREHLKNDATDIESVLRIAYLALLNDEIEECAGFLKRSSERAIGLATMANAEIDRFAPRSERTSTETLRWLRARLTLRRLESEANELDAIAAEIRKRTDQGVQKNKKNKISKRRKP